MIFKLKYSEYDIILVMKKNQEIRRKSAIFKRRKKERDNIRILNMLEEGKSEKFNRLKTDSVVLPIEMIIKIQPFCKTN